MRFPFFLAERLGMTVEELGRRMDQAEYVQWQALSKQLAWEEEQAMKQKPRGR